MVPRPWVWRPRGSIEPGSRIPAISQAPPTPLARLPNCPESSTSNGQTHGVEIRQRPRHVVQRQQGRVGEGVAPET